MPIQAVRGEYEVQLNHECNWNCPYCAIKTHTLPHISHQEAVDKLESIPRGSPVTLSGGEPGLILEPFLKEYINILESKDCTLYLNTNGLFLKRYPHLLKHFRQVVYHCSVNMNTYDEIIRCDNLCDIRYMIIVNDDNIENLESFLKYHDDIQFDIIEATYNNPGDGPTLSTENKHYIMTHYIKRMTKESIRRMIKEKDFESIIFI